MRISRKEIKIQILLATYNGEKYIREQLQSIAELEGNFKFQILLRDDCSTDRTMEIIDEFKKILDIKIIPSDRNVGLNKNMYILFENADSDYDYFAFCNQDDIWVKNKFITAVKKLEEFDSDIPLLFTSTSMIVDENLNEIGLSLIPKKTDFYNAMVQNVSLGHTQVFNTKFLDKLNGHYNKNIHEIDWWIYLIATALGTIVFDDKFTVLHRQHGNNSCGYELNFFKKTFNRIRYLKNGKSNSISLQLEAFLSEYGNEINLDHLSETKKFLYSQDNITKRINYSFKTKIRREGFFETTLLKLLYVIGKYKL